MASSRDEDERKALVDAYQAAMHRERELWDLLRSMKSDTPGYEDLWNQWMKAARATAAAAKNLREAFSGATRPGDLT
ncbi:MAG TPA: hypothetical protein VL593_05255 [Ramlibacter sp.]|jgi:hypothetical protein|nr:hypothetical protein [Ramlibacter sp.]